MLCLTCMSKLNKSWLYIYIYYNHIRNTKILLDNIYHNKPLNNIFSGNLSSVFSDHLIQFLIEPLDFSEKSSKMINRQRCYKNFDKFKFKADLVKVSWDGFCLTSNTSDVYVHFLNL